VRFIVEGKIDKAQLLLDGIAHQMIWNGHGIAPYEVFVNGERVEGWQEGTHFDRLVPEAEIGHLLQEGENEVLIKAPSLLAPVAALQEIIYITGDFLLLEMEPMPRIAERKDKKLGLGGWHSQGFPYFSGIGLYRKEFEWRGEVGEWYVCFEELCDACEVVINDKSAGIAAWYPYRINISRFLKEGVNTLELRVANTNHNLFRMDARPSGIVGRVYIAKGVSAR